MRVVTDLTAMAITGVMVAATIGALMHAEGVQTGKADEKARMSTETQENLSAAMHGEAFAYAKYMLYAEHARNSGHPELAALFEETAKTERLEHFAEEAELAGLVGSDEENLQDAIKGETYEVETMYRGFAAQASAAGDHAAAERFSEIRNDEMKHRDAYKAALDKLRAESAAAR